MPQNRTFKFGDFNFRCVMKTAGLGFEVTLTCNGKNLFVGNFIHATEARQWFTKMNWEIRGFVRKFKVGNKVSRTWYNHFISNHIYKSYYAFLDRKFTTYNREYNRACGRDLVKYRKIVTLEKTRARNTRRAA